MAEEIQHTELNALISLLDEPSAPVFGKIKEKILYYGIEAIPFLEDAWDNSFDNNIQIRIEEIIHSIQLRNLKAELISWKENNWLDLLEGFYLVSKYQYPDLDNNKLKEQIAKIEKDIWLELNSNLTALEKVKVVNHVLFDINRFAGNKANIDAPQNLFLNNLLESRKGNHLSLGILYIILSQKLGIPIFGVNLPQHFILAFMDEVHGEKIVLEDENEVLFYINPFNKGAVFTQREIELFIKHLKLKPSPSFYKPCDNISIIRRLFENVIYNYNKLGYLEKVEELKELLDVL
ncbi:MAG: transglutaminase-like domain-containing protein [Bacteroidales bacterium]|nr:transglutaminase-like domain-containing protein [Bacteroidales bacterium]